MDRYIETYQNHLINFQPIVTANGKFVADVKLTDLGPSGYRRSFSALGIFDNEVEAATFALGWIKSWIDHNRRSGELV